MKKQNCQQFMVLPRESAAWGLEILAKYSRLCRGTAERRGGGRERETHKDKVIASLPPRQRRSITLLDRGETWFSISWAGLEGEHAVIEHEGGSERWVVELEDTIRVKSEIKIVYRPVYEGEVRTGC